MEHNLSLIQALRGIALKNREFGTIQSLHRDPQNPTDFQLTVLMPDQSLFQQSMPEIDVTSFDIRTGHPVQIVRGSIVGNYIDLLATHTSLGNQPGLKQTN